MGIVLMAGKFTAIGMRVKVEDPAVMVVNTCGGNGTDERGTPESWVWSNPTNTAIDHSWAGVEAVSVECLWQGTKIFEPGGRPDEATLMGDWRRGKARRPIGAWAGEGRGLLTTPGAARRAIYVPAFRRLVEHWLQDDEVRGWVDRAEAWPGNVFLRDHDTGRGLDQRGPMSHAYVLAMFLNTGNWAFAGQ